MRRVLGIHFVCRGDANVVDYGDGTFDSGIWVVGRAHHRTVEYIALHERKAERSYRHGRVLKCRAVVHGGRERVIFTVRQEGPTMDWVGDGAGERGYRWS